MTIEEIIKRLKENAKPYEEYFIDPEVMEAMYHIANGSELIKPILELIGNNPTVDFGSPGYLVHFVESFYGKDYIELLINSVKKTPTPHNIWLLHRCYNVDRDNDIYKKTVMDLKNADTTPIEVKERIEYFDWD